MVSITEKVPWVKREDKPDTPGLQLLPVSPALLTGMSFLLTQQWGKLLFGMCVFSGWSCPAVSDFPFHCRGRLPPV